VDNFFYSVFCAVCHAVFLGIIKQKNVLMAITDAKIIEAIVNGVPNTIGAFSQALRKIQTGVVQHYATIMAMGVLLIVALMLLR